MTTILGNLLTILGIIIGFVWIGIGTELGKDAYSILVKDKALSIMKRIKEAKAKRIAQKIIRPDIKEEEEKKDGNTNTTTNNIGQK